LNVQEGTGVCGAGIEGEANSDIILKGHAQIPVYCGKKSLC